MQLVKHTRVQLIWVPGHEDIVGNGTDQLARMRYEHLFIGPEPACGIIIGVVKKAVMDWMNRNHKKHWESITRFRLIIGPSARRTKDLLTLNRDQLRWVVELFTGHCHLKGHLFKLGLTYDLICERCLEEDESAAHIPCDCEAIAYLRFCHMDQFFMEPSDYYDAYINKVLHFILSVGLIKGYSKWEAQQITDGRGPRAGLLWPTPHTFIHSSQNMEVTYSSEPLVDPQWNTLARTVQNS
jgi:hypothetical protein